MGANQVVEWKIENISCWREEIHSVGLESPRFLFLHFRYASLYPKGDCGRQNRMAVGISSFEYGPKGDLTFVGPDGSEICTQQVKVDFGHHLLVEGPEYAKVMGLVRECGRDQIILRFRFPSNHDHVQRMCTTLNVMDISLAIDPKTIESAESMDVVATSASSSERQALVIKAIRTGGTIELVCHPGNEFMVKVYVQCCVSLLKSDNCLVRCGKKERVLLLDSDPWTFFDSLQIVELLVEKTTILIDIKIISYNDNITNRYSRFLYYSKGVTIESDSSSRSDDSTSELLSDFKSLYLNSDFSDFRLRCDNVTFPVHRNILSARSPVFKSMFSDAGASDCMDIKDLDSPATLSRFLEFLYSGILPDLHEVNAVKLYQVAGEYQVHLLKEECADFLSDNISISNVREILTLAKKFKDVGLISAVNDFVLEHFYKFSSSEEWKRFTQKEPLLAEEANRKIKKINTGCLESKQSTPLFSTCPYVW